MYFIKKNNGRRNNKSFKTTKYKIDNKSRKGNKSSHKNKNKSSRKSESKKEEKLRRDRKKRREYAKRYGPIPMDLDYLANRPFTAMVCNVQIGGYSTTAVLDSGAATSVITSKLMKKLGEHIDEPSRIVITTITGDSKRSLGTIKDLNININGNITPVDVEVIDEPKREKLILGNDFLSTIGATIKYQDKEVILYPKTRAEVKAKVEYYEIDETDSDDDSESEDDSEIEYESDEDLDDVHIQDL